MELNVKQAEGTPVVDRQQRCRNVEKTTTKTQLNLEKQQHEDSVHVCNTENSSTN